MVIKFKTSTNTAELNKVRAILKQAAISFEEVEYFKRKYFILFEKTTLDLDFPFIAEVKTSDYPFKLVNRAINPSNVMVDVKGVKFGNNSFNVIAGVCSIESQQELLETAQVLKVKGVDILRAGAFKPRTSPYSFLGLKAEGLEILSNTKAAVKIPTVSEIMDFDDYPLFVDVDILQVGARNMQNFALLEKLGQTNKPIILKRGFSNTIEEWLLAAEYITKNGNPNIILCERGIRTFESYTRNTLDLSVISIVKKISNLPIIVDPSHATGKSELVVPMAKAALVAGADGIMLEVSQDPKNAISDGRQALNLAEFSNLMSELKSLEKAISK